MAVPSTMADLSTTDSSNSPAGSDAIGTSLDEYLRAIQGIMKRNVAIGSTLSATATVALPANGGFFVLTGTPVADITAIDSTNSWNGRVVALRFANGGTLSNTANLLLPGGNSIIATAGDTGMFVQESSGVWRCLQFTLGGAYQTIEIAKYIFFSSEYDNGNSGTTKTITLTNGAKQKLTLTGNCTITVSFSGAGVGTYQLRLIQDATGGRTVAWSGLSGSRWVGATSAPSINGNIAGETLVSIYYDGSSAIQSVSRVGVV